MTVKEYIKEAFRLTSLIFTTLVIISFFLQADALADTLGYMLLIAGISGSLHFLIADNEKYSNQRILFNQFLYLLIICLQITIANFWLHWELGWDGLLMNFVIVLVIYIFIQFVMYSNDRKEAEKINQYLQKRKRDKS